MNEQLYLKGRQVEARFKELFKNAIESSKKQDIFEHWDVQIGIKIDVKGLKKINRWDAEPDENIHWVEFRGDTGHRGWLYGGADYIAFETKDFFVIVERERLRKMVESKMIVELCSKPELYKYYNRNGSQDLLTLVKTIDLCYISSAIIEKGDAEAH